MNRWKRVGCLTLAAVLLLSACGVFTPLLSEKEVLALLSERYDGAEFTILETIQNCDYREEGKTIRCRLYLAAPAGEREHSFWVHSTVSKYYGGDSLPMRYSSGISDTYAFDYFLERFDALLTENNIEHFFSVQSSRCNLPKYLKTRHLQGGRFVILITPETAGETVAGVLAIREQIADEYPLSSYLEYFSHPAYLPIRVSVTFSDENHLGADGETPVFLASFWPYDKKMDENGRMVYRDTAESVLEDIGETLCELEQETQG